MAFVYYTYSMSKIQYGDLANDLISYKREKYDPYMRFVACALQFDFFCEISGRLAYYQLTYICTAYTI